MTSTIRPRSVLLAAATALLAPAWASADAIVLQNLSYIVGAAHVLENGLPTPGSVGQFFDPTGAIGGPPPPPGSLPPVSGTWALIDSVSYSERGATAAAAISVGGTLAPTQFTGSALTINTATADGADPGIEARSWGLAGYSVEFQLDQPHTFAYSAHYAGEGESQFGLMSAELERADHQAVFFADLFEPFTSLNESRSHTGSLEAGRYLLRVLSHPWYVTTPDYSRKVTALNFTFDLAPAAPIPEPATIVLLAAGLASVVRRRARGRKDPTGA